MSPTAILLLSSHAHSASLAAAAGAPAATLAQLTGYAFALITAGLIVMAIERVRDH
jgi:hypothetical protein